MKFPVAERVQGRRGWSRRYAKDHQLLGSAGETKLIQISFVEIADKNLPSPCAAAAPPGNPARTGTLT
jgi:hypothetical protein